MLLCAAIRVSIFRIYSGTFDRFNEHRAPSQKPGFCLTIANLLDNRQRTEKRSPLKKPGFDVRLRPVRLAFLHERFDSFGGGFGGFGRRAGSRTRGHPHR